VPFLHSTSPVLCAHYHSKCYHFFPNNITEYLFVLQEFLNLLQDHLSFGSRLCLALATVSFGMQDLSGPNDRDLEVPRNTCIWFRSHFELIFNAGLRGEKFFQPVVLTAVTFWSKYKTKIKIAQGEETRLQACRQSIKVDSACAHFVPALTTSLPHPPQY
jgi:hypothetical protein